MVHSPFVYVREGRSEHAHRLGYRWKGEAVTCVGEEDGWVDPFSFEELWLPQDLPAPSMKPSLSAVAKDGQIRYLMPALEFTVEAGGQRWWNRGVNSIPLARRWMDVNAVNLKSLYLVGFAQGGYESAKVAQQLEGEDTPLDDPGGWVKTFQCSANDALLELINEGGDVAFLCLNLRGDDMAALFGRFGGGKKKDKEEDKKEDPEWRRGVRLWDGFVCSWDLTDLPTYGVEEGLPQRAGAAEATAAQWSRNAEALKAAQKSFAVPVVAESTLDISDRIYNNANEGGFK